MSGYVNEYNPKNTRDVTVGVVSDPQKLKFNNIKSCIAVGVVPPAPSRLIGVHFTTASTVHCPAEMDPAIADIKRQLGGAAADVYLVAAFSEWHASTNLVKKLKTLKPGSIFVCDVPPTGAAREAEVDVKMERTVAGITTYIRPHVAYLKGADGRRTIKDKYADGTKPNSPGKEVYKTDRDDKPWMMASFRKLL